MVLSFVFVLSLVSCGLETEAFLEPVEIVSSDKDRAEIVLPDQTSIPSPDLFRNYAIYYRIYLSDIPPPAQTINLPSQRQQINPSLEAHYNVLNRYTTTDNVSPSAIDLEFRTLKYYSIFLRDVSSGAEKDLSAVLNSSLPPGTIIRLAFPTTQNSTLTDTFFNNVYDLLRANSFTSEPLNRLFVYSNNLANGNNVTNDQNTDIQKKTTGNENDIAPYAYVSMYILATGIDYNYSPLYSRIKHIGIFELK